MKSAVVTPFLKKSGLDQQIIKNYWPVSNLSFLSKTWERIVAARLTDYVTTNGLHDPLQSAYKTCHSTETALIQVPNDLLCTMDGRGVEVLIFLDLSAAFDTIDHSLLLARMRDVLGIKGS